MRTENSFCTIFLLLFGAYFASSRLDNVQNILLFLLLNHFADSDSRIIQFLSPPGKSSSAVLDALHNVHIEIESLLELCAQTS